MNGLACLAGVSSLILAGLFMTTPLHSSLPPATLQVSVLAVILSSLSTFLTPFSSALGGQTIVAPWGEGLRLGLGPLVGWCLGGAVIGLLSRKAKSALPPALLAPAIVYLLVLGLSMYVHPRLPGAVSWEVFLSRVAQAILLDGPLDFAFIYILPLSFSLLSASLVESITAKPVPVQPRKRRFWEWVEEE
ncbi:MAG: hypothetical protein QW470_04135 [Candidatus Caldarchaeum sp.]